LLVVMQYGFSHIVLWIKLPKINRSPVKYFSCRVRRC